MKLDIKLNFTDKYTGEQYKKDSVVDFSDERAKELLSDKRNLVSIHVDEVETVEEKVEEEKPAPKKRGKKS